MPDPLNTGSSALLAFQRAIATTSHNIANSTTEGYTRQGVNLQAIEGVNTRTGHIGQGVVSNNIIRYEDQFVANRIVQSTSEVARLQTLHSYASQVDQLFSQTGLDLSSALKAFNAAIADANNNPSELSARNSVVSATDHLFNRYQALHKAISGIQTQASNQLNLTINNINSAVAQISDLNLRIASSSHQSGQTPNSLIDQRNLLIQDLSNFIGIETYETENGSVNVTLKNGEPLIAGEQTTHLDLIKNSSQATGFDIRSNIGSSSRIISGQITGGELGALTDVSKNILSGTLNEIGRMSLSLAQTFNLTQRNGLDLNGNTGRELFTIGELDVIASQYNTGSASINVNLTDSSKLTTSDYKLELIGTEHRLTRISDNTSVTGSDFLQMDGISVEISAPLAQNDIFTILPTRNASRDITLNASTGSSLALGYPISVDASEDNANNTSPVISAIIDPLNPDLNSPVTISFNEPPSSFDIRNTATGAVVASNIGYTVGEDIKYNGWAIQFNSQPAALDEFLISPSINGFGDNRNGLALYTAINSDIVAEQSTLHEAYGQLLASVGTQTRQHQLNTEAATGLLDYALTDREAVSGVNLDEEAIALTKYQQAYQAAAQIINTSDQMFQTLIGAIRG